MRKYKIEQKDQIPSIREGLKQKLQVKAQRLRTFDKRNKFFRQNKIFETDAKKFYREKGKNTISVEEIPSEKRVRVFWESIWGNVKTHKEDAEWLRKLKDKNEELHEQEWEDIQIEDVQDALRKSHKWKSPGVDKVPNFWLNALKKHNCQFWMDDVLLYLDGVSFVHKQNLYKEALTPRGKFGEENVVNNVKNKLAKLQGKIKKESFAEFRIRVCRLLLITIPPPLIVQ